MVEGYRLIQRLPTVEEYIDICSAVGWGAAINFEAAIQALPASVFGAVISWDSKTVGMGRIVGDGAIYYYLQDIAVKPEHQGKGLGKEIVMALLSYISQTAPDKAFVGLFATPEARQVYEHSGFAEYEDLVGMFQTTPFRLIG